MRHSLTLAIVFCLFASSLLAQLSLQNGTNNYLIDFDVSVSGVSAGTFAGGGITPAPAAGLG